MYIVYQEMSWMSQYRDIHTFASDQHTKATPRIFTAWTTAGTKIDCIKTLTLQAVTAELTFARGSTTSWSRKAFRPTLWDAIINNTSVALCLTVLSLSLRRFFKLSTHPTTKYKILFKLLYFVCCLRLFFSYVIRVCKWCTTMSQVSLLHCKITST